MTSIPPQNLSMSYPLSLPTKNPLVTLTHPTDCTWVIELHNGQDNRLTTELIDHGLKPLLDVVESHWRENWRTANKTKNPELAKGSLIIVGRKIQDKFFSNGLDFQNVVNDANFFPLTFNPLLKRIIQFPIPTVAAINGHCFAGGFMLALACDYRVMTEGTERNAWLCMNEVHFGAPWPLSFAAVLRTKIGDDRLRRKIALEGHRFTPQEALKAGIIDQVAGGNTAMVLERANDLATLVSACARSGVWGIIKNDLYRETLETIGKDVRTTSAQIEDRAARARL